MTLKKSLNLTVSPNPTLKERIDELEARIKTRHEDMKLLIAFAIGKKTMPPHYRKAPRYWQRTENDDRRLLNSLRQMRLQIHEWQEEIAKIKEKQR